MNCVSCGVELKNGFKFADFCWRCEEILDNDGAAELIKLAIDSVLKAERAREKDRLLYHTELSNAKLWYEEFRC